MSVPKYIATRISAVPEAPVPVALPPPGPANACKAGHRGRRIARARQTIPWSANSQRGACFQTRKWRRP